MFGVDYFAKKKVIEYAFLFLIFARKKEYGFNKEQTVYP